MIRKMEIEDIDAVVEIETSRFSSPYKKENFLYEIENNVCAFLYVLEEAKQIVGYIDYWITFDSCQLCKIALRSDVEHKGYGDMLMQHMFIEAKKEACEAILLEVRVSNKHAISFYEHYDFLEINIRKNYYSNPKEDALVMGKVMVGE